VVATLANQDDDGIIVHGATPDEVRAQFKSR
jgi:hypothetical protein